MDNEIENEIKDNEYYFVLGLAVLDLSDRDYRREQRKQTDPD